MVNSAFCCSALESYLSRFGGSFHEVQRSRCICFGNSSCVVFAGISRHNQRCGDRPDRGHDRRRQVTVTEIQTGTKAETASDNTGQYTVPFLAPGDYQIVVKIAGFKEFVRKGVHLGAGDHVGVDARLEVGEVTQSVEVTAEVSMVNAESASVGQASRPRKWTNCRSTAAPRWCWRRWRWACCPPASPR